MPQEFVKVASTGELPPGTKRLVEIEGQRILLVNLAGKYYAVDELCPHAYGILSRGQLYGDEVVCPVHGAAFDVKTGTVLTPPAEQDLTAYQVKVQGDDILVGPPRT